MATSSIHRLFETRDGGLSLWRIALLFVPATALALLLMAYLLPPPCWR